LEKEYIRYYKWSKLFLEAGKSQLSGNTIRKASSGEVKQKRASTLLGVALLKNHMLLQPKDFCCLRLKN